jgi:Protein of unknown function (DUF1524)
MQKTKWMRSSIVSFKFFTSNATRKSLALVAALTLVALGSAGAVGNSQIAQAATATKASAALAGLKVQPWASHAGYARAQFSDGWGKIGSCDTRNYILQRDLSAVTWRSGASCEVATGTLNDPYTGKVIHFVRGVQTSLAVQIDHVVPLSNAWMTGAQSISATSRYSLYNDPLNLLAVDGPTNEAKSDSDASAWLPPRAAFRCSYVARQIAVKRKYHLWVTSAEKSAMQSVLAGCPSQLLPTR